MFKEMNYLKLFFEEPTREFHLRELARILKKNPVTVKKHLQDFIKQEVLNCKKEKHLEIYTANQESTQYKEYKRTYNRFKIIDSKILDFLDEKFSFPTIILFGSYEKGEDNNNSDIDIFILSEVKEEVDTEPYKKRLNRPIQLHIMNKKEFERAKIKNPELINSIINGSVLKGFIEVL